MVKKKKDNKEKRQYREKRQYKEKRKQKQMTGYICCKLATKNRIQCKLHCKSFAKWQKKHYQENLANHWYSSLYILSHSMGFSVSCLCLSCISCHDFLWFFSSSFKKERGAFFAWRAPILSWPRTMCSQVRMLKFFRTVTKNAINKSVWRKKDCFWLPLNKRAMNIWLSSLRIRAHLSWRTGKHLHVLHVLQTYSTCSHPGW